MKLTSLQVFLERMDKLHLSWITKHFGFSRYCWRGSKNMQIQNRNSQSELLQHTFSVCMWETKIEGSFPLQWDVYFFNVLFVLCFPGSWSCLVTFGLVWFWVLYTKLFGGWSQHQDVLGLLGRYKKPLTRSVSHKYLVVLLGLSKVLCLIRK